MSIPEFDQSQFEELFEMVKENNEMLREQSRTSRLQSLGKVIKLVAILALVIGAIVFLRPYLQNAKKIYDSVQQNIESISETAQSVGENKDQATEFFEGFSDEFNEVGVFFEGFKKPQATADLEAQG